jgi:membrane protein
VPGAIVAAVGVHLASAGFSIYLDRLGGFNDVFGPLGAILAFLLLVYAAAAILLLGACVVAAWPETATQPENQDAMTLRSRLVSAARGLVVRDRSQ